MARTKLVKQVELNWKYVESVSKNYLQQKNQTLKEWLQYLKCKTNRGDEMSVFLLSQLYGVHTCIYTKNKIWNTVGIKLNKEMGLKVCQVKLLYLGENLFCELSR